MSTEFLREQLHSINNAKKVNRERVANIVCNNSELLKPLVDSTFKVEDPISIKAAWVLEWICIHKNLELIFPYLNQFIDNLQKLRFHSAIRPCAKICEALAIQRVSNKNIELEKELTPKQIEQLIETAFDWLLTPQKIAVRAYSMHTLYLLGTLPGKEWIHPELENLIRTKIIHEGKGCKARGKHLLKKIESFKS